VITLVILPSILSTVTLQPSVLSSDHSECCCSFSMEVYH